MRRKQDAKELEEGRGGRGEGGDGGGVGAKAFYHFQNKFTSFSPLVSNNKFK